MATTLSPQDFVSKWRQAARKERSAYQEHFIDICRLIGHPTPGEMDPGGGFFTFEAGASKQAGGEGWADVWYKGRFAWEYKGKHANLEKAYQQLLQYRESLQNPPLLIVSDLEQIHIHTNFTNTVKRIYLLGLEDLLQPAGVNLLRSAFYEPEALRAPLTSEHVTQQAAKQFARIAEMLRASGEPPPRIAHFLIQLLFCLFAEDVGLLPNRLFTSLVERSRTRPAAFGAQLQQLFSAMSTGGWFGAEEIAHFDGHLFDDALAMELDADGLDTLAQVTNLDWSSIEPSIFGTLFERSLDPSKRAQLGAHYTSKEDILLIVEPVLMAPWRRKWEAVQDQARDLAAKRDATRGQPRSKLQARLAALLTGFAGELAGVRVLDPACGSGNFLYVTLRQLLDLEKEVITLAAEIGVGRFFPSIGPAQLHGIEINEYAQQLAQATIWIGYIQWLTENGFGFPAEPVLKPLDNILLMDAILAYDEEGKPVEPEWPEAEVIIGNPPFLGDKKMRTELGDKYVDNLRSLYANRILGQSDLVCYWFEKALVELINNRANRVGLLATQGIRGGANRKVLDRIYQDGQIFWAQSDHNWILDGAMVHVSMVGFDLGQEMEIFLDNKSVKRIFSDLTSKIDLTSAKVLIENKGLSFIGTQKNGPFDLSIEQANRFKESSLNPNRKPNSDVIKPWINALDITNRPRRKWIIDFGANMPINLAAEYEIPFEYVREKVKPLRDKVRRKNHREKWWLFGESRPGMRKALSGLNRYIVTPMVSKFRLFTFIQGNVIPENLLVVIARSDDYFLGVLHSFIHELWSRNKGTQLREAQSGQRYTPSTTFETFPFPWPPGQEPASDPRVQAIAEAAHELVEKREAWLNPPGASEAELKKRTLTNLYNQRPTWLEMAHQKLDRAVFVAYGWPEDLSDEEILERLLALNLDRAGRSSQGGNEV